MSMRREQESPAQIRRRVTFGASVSGRLMPRRSPRSGAALACVLCTTLAPHGSAQAAPLVLDPGTAAVFQRLAPAVLRLEVQESQSKAKVSVGSGFYAASDGRIVTNFHVVSRLVH